MKVFNPRLPKVMNFPRFNNADIDWYIRMPEGPPPFDPKIKYWLSYVRKNMPLWN